MRLVTYGRGGFDPSKPDGNVIEEREVEVEDTPPSPEERIAALEDEIREMRERIDRPARD